MPSSGSFLFTCVFDSMTFTVFFAAFTLYELNIHFLSPSTMYVYIVLFNISRCRGRGEFFRSASFHSLPFNSTLLLIIYSIYPDPGFCSDTFGPGYSAALDIHHPIHTKNGCFLNGYLLASLIMRRNEFLSYTCTYWHLRRAPVIIRDFI